MKKKVIRRLPDAFCVKLDKLIEGNAYIVWPGKIQPRGFERSAIGLGVTARAAWHDAWNTIKEPKP